ncbi:MAG: hypothetical protein ACYS99_19820, partial [Planctomycetota bacterium]
AVPALLDLLPAEGRDVGDLSETERALAMEALEALGYLGGPDTTARLASLLAVEWPLALEDRSDDRHHFEAAVLLMTALGRIGEPAALPPLVELIFTPELHRWFALLAEDPPQGNRSLLGTLVRALVRFPDARLAEAARAVLDRLRTTGDAYRIDEGYLLHAARLLSDPRREGIRRPQPRRELAAEIYRLVLTIAPRESDGDLVACSWLSDHASNAGRFEEAEALWERARELDEVLHPLGHSERRAYYLARRDFLRGLGRNSEEIYDRGLTRDRDDPEILTLYAWWLAATEQRLDDALEVALAAGRRAASDARVIATIGFTLHRLGRHKEAVLRLREAVELDAERAEKAARDEDRHRDPLFVYLLAASTTRAGFAVQGAEALALAVSMDDTLADAARASPDFEPLAKEGLLEQAIEVGLSAIPR